MTSLQRLHAILRGQRADRVPNFDIFMTRAAHHIGARLSTYYLDRRVLCAANLAVLDDFGPGRRGRLASLAADVP